MTTTMKQLFYDLLKEQQIKLGYYEGSSALFFPEKSFDHLLGIRDEMRCEKGICRQMRCEKIAELKEKLEPTLGEVKITKLGERFRVEISATGNAYVHEHVKEDPFTLDMVALFSNHHVSLKQVKDLFLKHDEHYEFMEVEGSGFEYIFSLSDKQKHPYYYLMHQDGEHMTYHRYLEIEEFIN